MVGLGAVPAGTQFFVLFFLPESREYVSAGFLCMISQCERIARILIRKGNFDGARAILAKVYGHATPKQVDLKVHIYANRRLHDSNEYTACCSPIRGQAKH